MADITTTEPKHYFRCDLCRKKVAIRVHRPGNKRVCIECLPEDEKDVFVGLESLEEDAESPAA